MNVRPVSPQTTTRVGLLTTSQTVEGTDVIIQQCRARSTVGIVAASDVFVTGTRQKLLILGTGCFPFGFERFASDDTWFYSTHFSFLSTAGDIRTQLRFVTLKEFMLVTSFMHSCG